MLCERVSITREKSAMISILDMLLRCNKATCSGRTQSQIDNWTQDGRACKDPSRKRARMAQPLAELLLAQRVQRPRHRFVDPAVESASLS